MSRCIIIGAGEFTEQFLTIEKDDFVIAADGGFDYLQQQNIKPDLWLGDMDSTNYQPVDAEDMKRIQLPKEKDDTDTLAAIKYGMQLGYQKFQLHGMLGGRIDHTIANIQCLEYLRQHGADGILYGKDSFIVQIHNEKVIFPENMQGSISVFAWGEDAKGVTEQGLYYEITDAELTTSYPIGVSNEFTGAVSSIEVKQGTLLICVIPKQPQTAIDMMRIEKRK